MKGTEMIAANHRLPLAKHAAEILPLPQLTADVRAAIVNGDRVAQFLFSQVLPARLETPVGPGLHSNEDEAARAELRRRPGQIKPALRDTSGDPIRRRTEEALAKAPAARTQVAK